MAGDMIARGLRRWLAFNAVGAMGVAVQLVALVTLTEAAGLDYRIATVLAVETAILHNFLWHERWTWRDRAAGSAGPWTRLAWFNLVTGTLSISANVAFTTLYVSALGVHYTLANLLAIASCSLLNFIANDRFVFRARAAPPARAADPAPAARAREEEPVSDPAEREMERTTTLTSMAPAMSAPAPGGIEIAAPGDAERRTIELERPCGRVGSLNSCGANAWQEAGT